MPGEAEAAPAAAGGAGREPRALRGCAELAPPVRGRSAGWEAPLAPLQPSPCEPWESRGSHGPSRKIQTPQTGTRAGSAVGVRGCSGTLRRGGRRIPPGPSAVGGTATAAERRIRPSSLPLTPVLRHRLPRGAGGEGAPAQGMLGPPGALTSCPKIH